MKFLFFGIFFISLNFGCKKEKRQPDDTAVSVKKSKIANQVKRKKTESSNSESSSNIKKKKTEKKEEKKATKSKTAEKKAKSNLIEFSGKKLSQPLPHKMKKDKQGFLYQLDSFDFAKAKVKGYAAPIRLQVVFDKKGKIIQVEIKDHKETKSFIERVEKEWIGKFSGLESHRKITGKNGIDALTECTKSTQAIKKSVDTLRKLFLKNFKSK